jgi:hypothetical protein
MRTSFYSPSPTHVSLFRSKKTEGFLSELEQGFGGGEYVVTFGSLGVKNALLLVLHLYCFLTFIY